MTTCISISPLFDRRVRAVISVTANESALRTASTRKQTVAASRLTLLFLFFGLLSPQISAAVQPQEDPEEHRQPDGTTILLVPMQRGSEKWFADEAGYSVVRTADRYEYAVVDKEGGLKATGVLVGSVDPRKSALPPRLRPSPEFLQRQRAEGPTGSVPPSPHPVEVQQPDGTTIKLTLRGGPHYSWYEDEHRYTVIRVPGRYEYALRGPEGKLIGSGILAGSMPPDEAGFKRQIKPAESPDD